MSIATLTWTASTDTVDGYNVYRGIAAGAETDKLNKDLITADTFVDSTITDGEFFWIVRSVKGGVESANSNEVFAVILPPPPAPPTNLTVVVT